MARIRPASSSLARNTRTLVSVPRISPMPASPIARIWNVVPKPPAWATRPRITSDPVTTVSRIVIRLITSDHIVPRVASRLQCSVASSCATTAGGGSVGLGFGHRCLLPGCADCRVPAAAAPLDFSGRGRATR